MMQMAAFYVHDDYSITPLHSENYDKKIRVKKYKRSVRLGNPPLYALIVRLKDHVRQK